jgi:hypothetical protein
MKKTIVALLLVLIWLNFTNTHASSWEIDLTWKSSAELLEFYKANPDYWKKRLEINYDKYIQWEYFVLRWEYLDKITWEPIKDKAINFTINWETYSYVTSEKWIFNLEMDKKELIDINSYNIKIEIDWYTITTRVKWKELKEKSIYHFKIHKEEWWTIHTLSLETIHNPIFKEWREGFTIYKKVKATPSNAWIQWIWIYILAIALSIFITYFYFSYKKKISINKTASIVIPRNMR